MWVPATGREWKWVDNQYDDYREKLLIATLKQTIASSKSGYVSGPEDLLILAKTMKKIVDYARIDLSTLKQSDVNTITNVNKLCDQVIAGTYNDDGTGFVKALALIENAIKASSYTYDNIGG